MLVSDENTRHITNHLGHQFMDIFEDRHKILGSKFKQISNKQKNLERPFIAQEIGAAISVSITSDWKP